MGPKQTAGGEAEQKKPVDHEPNVMMFNDVFSYIGDVGLFQLLLYVLIGLTAFFNGLHNTSNNFYAAPMPHWCQVDRLQTFPHEIQKKVAIPYDAEDPEEFDSCHVFDLDYTNLTNAEIWSWDRNLTNNASLVPCTAWVYDQSEFLLTIISKYNLVCDKAWLADLTSTLYMAGSLIGSLVPGILSDRFGRKIPLLSALVGYLLFGCLQGVAPKYTYFAIIRFLLAICSKTAFMCAFVIVTEVLGPSHYVLMTTCFHIFRAVGFMILPGIAYVIRDTDKLFLAISLPIACTFPFIWAVPESARWQIAKKRYVAGEKTLRYISDVNQSEPLPQHIRWTSATEKAAGDKDMKKGSWSDLFRSRVLCRELSLIYLNWFTASLVYYGVSFNTDAFGDVFLNTFLSGLVEVPADLLCYVCLQRIGRRWPNGSALLVNGAFSLALVPVLLLRPDMTGLLTALSTIAKGAITFAFTSVYLFSAELFPTPVRHLAIGSAAMMSRVGSMASPFLGSTLESVWKPMPSVIFGTLALFSGSMVFMLPETKGRPVPDTIEEAEEIGRLKKRKKSAAYKVDESLVINVDIPEKDNDAFSEGRTGESSDDENSATSRL